MSTGKDRVIEAAERCDESGFERYDGKWVDPLEVQAVSIDEAFKQAMDTREHDIWTVVNKEATLRENKTVAENFRAAAEAWADQADRSLSESPLVEELLEQAEDMEQDG